MNFSTHFKFFGHFTIVLLFTLSINSTMAAHASGRFKAYISSCNRQLNLYLHSFKEIAQEIIYDQTGSEKIRSNYLITDIDGLVHAKEMKSPNKNTARKLVIRPLVRVLNLPSDSENESFSLRGKRVLSFVIVQDDPDQFVGNIYLEDAGSYKLVPKTYNPTHKNQTSISSSTRTFLKILAKEKETVYSPVNAPAPVENSTSTSSSVSGRFRSFVASLVGKKEKKDPLILAQEQNLDNNEARERINLLLHYFSRNGYSDYASFIFIDGNTTLGAFDKFHLVVNRELVSTSKVYAITETLEGHEKRTSKMINNDSSEPDDNQFVDYIYSYVDVTKADDLLRLNEYINLFFGDYVVAVPASLRYKNKTVTLSKDGFEKILNRAQDIAYRYGMELQKEIDQKEKQREEETMRKTNEEK